MDRSTLAAPEREFALLLDMVYEASLEPQCWAQALKLIVDWLGASRALLFTPRAAVDAEGFFYSHGVSPEEMTIWNSRYVGRDFWTSRVTERGLAFEGNIFRDGDLSTRAELLASDYYREHLMRMDIGWLLTGIILARPEANLPIVVLSTYRGVQATEGFDDTARERMALLLPHLSRALAVMLKLRQAEHKAAAAANVLDALSCGVALLDRQGRVVHANRRAESIWRASNGLARDAQGEILVTDRASRKAWHAALRATLNISERIPHFSEALSVRRASGEGSLLAPT